MLMRRVARLYYEHGLTHQEIADQLGLNRVRVTRLLAEARSSGVVEIIVHADDAVFADEQQALIESLGLRHVWVAPTSSDAARSDASITAVGAEALRELVRPESVVAVGVSTTLGLVADGLNDPTLGGIYVPIGGSTAGLSRGANPHEIALRLARQAGGSAFHIPAPLVAVSEAAAEGIRSDPGVADGLERAAAADVLLAGIGDAGPGILFDALDEELRAELSALGAVGDMGGRFFDSSGAPIAGALDGRVVALSLDQLRAIPTRVAIARGANKVDALRAAALGGLVDGLVTDVETARALIR